MRDYYCNLKFRFLKIDLEAGTTLNCHAAKTHKVNIEWLKKNPGQLFNNEISVNERRQMLVNDRNSSCEQNCWPAEDRKQPSPRLYQNGQIRSHFDPITTPEVFDITVGSDCNLTCSYCCKEYSSAWRRDILINGNYDMPWSDSRYTASSLDQVRSKVNQSQRAETQSYRLLLNELALAAPHLKEIVVTGGEPFLNNKVIDILSNTVSSNCEVQIYTGLKVNYRRLEKMLTKLQAVPNLQINVSAENIGQLLEFNRYGLSWSEFDQRVKLLKSLGIKFEFYSTLSNLTVHGFADFVQYYNDRDINLTFAYQPSMMACHVMDDSSKMSVLNSIKSLNQDLVQKVSQALIPSPSDQDRQNLKTFLPEFVKRRKNLSLDIFPVSFRNWLEI